MAISTETGTERLAAPRVDVASPRGSARRSRFPRLRNVAVAGTSFAILLTGALYIAAPSNAAWAISVQRRHDTRDIGQDNEHGRHNSRTGTAVLYGKATDTHGQGVAGVQILLLRSGHDSGPVATFVSGPDGTFQQTVTLRTGKYRLTVVQGSGHRHAGRASTSNIRLSPGNTYQINVHLRHAGFAFFLPISSY